MFEINKAHFLRGKEHNAPNIKKYWLRLIFFLVVINSIFVIVFSKFIVPSKIYLPSYFILSQVLIYQVEKSSLLTELGGTIYNFPYFILYLSTFVIAIPLFVFSYYKLGAKYTRRSIWSAFIYSVIGILFSFKIIQDWSGWSRLDLLKWEKDTSLSERIGETNYYFVAFFSGIIMGVLVSFLWKNQISGGGLDFFYTYLSVVKRSNPRKISLPVNIVFVSLGIFISEYFIGDKETELNLMSFLKLAMASLGYGYISQVCLERIYPKFAIINLWIVTNKEKEISKELKKRYKRGGNIIESKGLYDNKNKKIITTAMTYVEKEEIERMIKKIDPNVFFIAQRVIKIGGKFQYFLI